MTFDSNTPFWVPAGIGFDDTQSTRVLPREIIRRTWQANPEAEPDELAKMACTALRHELGAAYLELQNYCITQWVMLIIRDSRKDVRDDLAGKKFQQPCVVSHGTQAPSRDRTASALVNMCKSWFTWPLERGLLGNATKSQVMDEAARYRKVAKSSQARCDWLDAIAEALPDDSTTVSKTLTEAQLAQLAQRFGVVTDQGGV
jgi:hypothetical protein